MRMDRRQRFVRITVTPNSEGEGGGGGEKIRGRKAFGARYQVGTS